MKQQRESKVNDGSQTTLPLVISGRKKVKRRKLGCGIQ